MNAWTDDNNDKQWTDEHFRVLTADEALRNTHTDTVSQGKIQHIS